MIMDGKGPRVPLNSVDDLLRIISGGGGDKKAKITLVVLYSFGSVDGAITDHICEHLSTDVPGAPSTDRSGNELDDKQREEIRNDYLDKLWSAIWGLPFRTKARQFHLLTCGHFNSLSEDLRAISEVRNSVAHESHIDDILFRECSISSDEGLNRYFMACQQMNHDIRKYTEKNIVAWRYIQEVM
ncbi:hypothetical protein JXA47_11850, partial [Candidatus Sumerlaeota bacterium]|nr:hypothetical protein [Candidatus Sumerlaeota bacterium]